MGVARPIYVITLFLFAGLLLAASPVRAETALIELLKATPKWFGAVGEGNQFAVTFDVVGDPPALESISYRWGQSRERDAVEFKLGKADIEFMIPPESRNRWYKLVLTKDGALRGSLTGLIRDKSRSFYNFVLLRPVGAAKGTVTELKGSTKHCSMPPGFAVSDGEGLSPELKRFLGFFGGSWENRLYHTLLVAEITEDGRNAIAYYAHEAYEPWSVYKPGCSRRKVKIEDGVLTLPLSKKVTMKYRFSDANTLQGQYDWGNRTISGTFKRLE